MAHRADEHPLAEARATTKRVARTFALACRLLPRPLRDDVYLTYLVFRTLDDLVDSADAEASVRLEAVEAWCVGEPADSREARLLSELERRHPLPRYAIADFCRGMRDDLVGTAIQTERDLDVYCHRVAGTVGIVMAALLGATDPAAPLHAAALGKAMQRTNILRDIDEDLANGRVYLARETLARFGCDGVPPPPAEREPLLRDQIARADALYDVGLDGISLLPCGRRAISAAGAMYREILRQIERDGYGLQGRAIVSRKRKLLVAARARTPST